MIQFSKARFCNEDDSAAVVDFTLDGAGEVEILTAPFHRDEVWQALLASGFPVQPFESPEEHA